jgi:hypothetical protein
VVVPWCTTCDRFLSPSSVTTAGDCPRCGRAVDPGRARAAAAEPVTETAGVPADASEDADWVPDLAPVPWHLKLLAGAVAVYLGWRAFQGIEWIIHRL